VSVLAPNMGCARPKTALSITFWYGMLKAIAWRTRTSSKGLMTVESARYLSVFAIGADCSLNFFVASMSAISRGGRSGEMSASPFSMSALRVPAAETLRYIAR